MISYPNSLVRDKSIELFVEKGADCTFQILPDVDFHTEVIRKVNVVFSQGYMISEDPEAAVADLVEAIELMYTLAKIQGINRDEMERMVKDKRDTRGGFDGKILLTSIDLPHIK